MTRPVAGIRRDLTAAILAAVYPGGQQQQLISHGQHAGSNWWIIDYAQHCGNRIDPGVRQGYIISYSKNLLALAAKLGVSVRDRLFGLIQLSQQTEIEIPLWFIGAVFWCLGNDKTLYEWWYLDHSNKLGASLTGDALFRRMLRKLKGMTTERGQNLLLVEALLAPGTTITKRVGQAYLRAAVADGMPKARRRVKNA